MALERQTRQFRRRDVLKTIGAVAAGAVAGADAVRLLAEGGRVPEGIRFGVQTNAFPIDPKRLETFFDALGTIKGIGYQGFETGFRNLMPQFDNPGPVRQRIEQTGLTFFGIHIFLADPMYDKATHVAPAALYEQVARGGAALGAKHLILSGSAAGDSEELKRKIEALNAAGKYAKSVGLSLAYHNHWWEFQSKIGEIEALYSETDHGLVHFVLDAGHAYHGGAQVTEFIRSHAKRIVGFHLRDYKNGRLAILGTGSFPLKQVAATIKEIGWKGWVENEEEREDQSKNGADVVAPAYKAMKEAFES